MNKEKLRLNAEFLYKDIFSDKIDGKFDRIISTAGANKEIGYRLRKRIATLISFRSPDIEKDVKATMKGSQLLRARWEQVRHWYSPEERSFLDKIVLDVLFK